jgi:hypothetical protein
MMVCLVQVKEINFRPACTKLQMLFAGPIMQKMHRRTRAIAGMKGPPAPWWTDHAQATSLDHAMQTTWSAPQMGIKF